MSCVLCSILNISDIRFTKFRIIVLINAGWEWVQGEAGHDGDKKLKWLNTSPPHHLCGVENTHMRLGGSSWQTCISSHLDPLLTSFIYLPYQHMSKNLSIFFVFKDFFMLNKSKDTPKKSKCYLVIRIHKCLKKIINTRIQNLNYYTFFGTQIEVEESLNLSLSIAFLWWI